MNFQWTPDRIRFMEDASRRSTYFQTLSAMLAPYLEGCTTVCDAGCGLGQLSAELGKRGLMVTGADLSKEAIAYLAKQHYPNVTPLCTDLLQEERLSFDAMVFHYFGSMEETLRIGRKLSKGPLLIIKKNYAFHRFSLGENPIQGHTGLQAEEFLKGQGIPYEKRLFELEMGQPFRTVEDAILFYRLYSRDQEKSLLSEENVVSRLEKTNDKEFPYYLPQKRSSLLLVLKEYGTSFFTKSKS